MVSDKQDREGQGRPRAPEGAGRLLLSLLATVTGNLFLLLGTTVMATCTVLTGWIPLPRGGRVFFLWARWWSKLLLLASGVRVRAEHQTPLPRDGVYVFLSNHQSL